MERQGKAAIVTGPRRMKPTSRQGRGIGKPVLQSRHSGDVLRTSGAAATDSQAASAHVAVSGTDARLAASGKCVPMNAVDTAEPATKAG